jgi:hypothetical protein
VRQAAKDVGQHVLRWRELCLHGSGQRAMRRRFTW